MTKKTFLNKLRSKIQILEEQEINDITEEYSPHIDDKMEQGKTEKEAVADFGDIDELAKEILSAYKINNDYQKEESRFEKNVNDFFENTISFFGKLFSEVEKQKPSKIFSLIIYSIFILLFIGVIMWFIKIPFELAKEIGVSLINVSSSNFLTETLEFIFRLFMDVTGTIVAIIIVVSLIKRTLTTYNENNKEEKVVVSKMKKEETKTIKEAKTENLASIKEKENKVIMDFFIVLSKICVVVFVFIPVLATDIGFAIALGVTIFLAFKGITTIGVSFILLGCLTISLALTTIVTKFLFSKDGVK